MKPHRGFLSDDDPRHGSVTGFMYWGCRCDDCANAFRAYNRDKMRERRAAARTEAKPKKGRAQA